MTAKTAVPGTEKVPPALAGVRQAKQEFRRRILKQLKVQSEGARQKKSLAIREKLFRLPTFRQARTVMFYVALPTEVDTHPMIDEALRLGKRVAVPVTDVAQKELAASLIENRQQDLAPGPYGTHHPKPHAIRPVALEEIDMVIVPGLAFTPAGERLGRGKGFYDRFLSRLPARTATLGLAFDFQVLSRLPLDPHDVRVKRVLSV